MTQRFMRSFLGADHNSQQREAIIIANIINRWNSFGQCISVKTP